MEKAVLYSLGNQNQLVMVMHLYSNGNAFSSPSHSKHSNEHTDVRAYLRAGLHGEFHPGLKFRYANRAEISLGLHAQFQPGRKTQISMKRFIEVQKQNRYVCSRFFFSPG